MRWFHSIVPNRTLLEGRYVLNDPFQLPRDPDAQDPDEPVAYDGPAQCVGRSSQREGLVASLEDMAKNALKLE